MLSPNFAANASKVVILDVVIYSSNFSTKSSIFIRSLHLGSDINALRLLYISTIKTFNKVIVRVIPNITSRILCPPSPTRYTSADNINLYKSFLTDKRL